LNLNNLSLNNDIRGSNDLYNWYQSLVALDLGSIRFLKKPINPNFQEIDLWLKFTGVLKIECYNDAYNCPLYLFGNGIYGGYDLDVKNVNVIYDHHHA
nr:hypothetical protein [Tanacetum cinerariifolium]